MMSTAELHQTGFGVALPPAPEPDRDFDFLHGSWLVENRRSRDPLAATEEWSSFAAVHTCRSLGGGLGNIHQAEAEDSDNLTSLQLFDRTAGRWAVHVLSQEGALRPPLYGRFHAGRGVFVGRWRERGKEILARHEWLWTPSERQWTQSFSSDGGRTWHANWLMWFDRVAWPA